MRCGVITLPAVDVRGIRDLIRIDDFVLRAHDIAAGVQDVVMSLDRQLRPQQQQQQPPPPELTLQAAAEALYNQ